MTGYLDRHPTLIVVLTFGLGILTARALWPPHPRVFPQGDIVEQRLRVLELEPRRAAAESPKPTYDYRVLQDREHLNFGAGETLELLQENLNYLGFQGWELVNPTARYFEDHGFSVVTGGFPENPSFSDPRAVLLLRRERR